MRRAVLIGEAILALAVVVLLLPWFWLFEHVVDDRLARCEPYRHVFTDSGVEADSTYVWHRHSLLFLAWWASHEDGYRDYARIV